MAGEIQLNSTTMATESSGTITLSNVDSATNRTNLGLGSMATQNANSVALTGGSITGTTIVPTTPFSFRNRIINGDMRIDQRNAGASVTQSNVYMLDRWVAIQSGTPDRFSVQQNAGAVTPPVGFANYLGVVSISAHSLAANDFFQIKQSIEGFNVADFDWGTANARSISVSFWVRSSLTGNFGVVVSWGSSVANQRTYPILYSITSANTWEYKTITIPGDTTMAAGGFETGNGSGVQLRFSLGGGATNAGTSGSWATANNQTVIGDTSVVSTNGATFYITGVQLEEGTVATPFEHRPISVELSLAQRYYQQIDFKWDNGGVYTGTGWYITNIPFITQMRADPTLLSASAWKSNTGDATTIQSGGSVVNGWTSVGASTNQVNVRGGNTNVYYAIQGRAKLSAEL